MEFASEDLEPDYLVPAQSEVSFVSFERVVREAFLIEHDCIQKQQIAQVLGVDKSRVSQILKHPENLKLETIHNLLDCLSGTENRRRIVRAWALACFGEDIEDRSQGTLTAGKVTKRTVDHVFARITQNRVATAAHLSLEAAMKTDDWVLRQRLLDEAYYTHSRLDEPGHAMHVARLIIESGMAAKDPMRTAAGHILRAKVFLAMYDAATVPLEPILAEVEALIASMNGNFPVAKDLPYIIGDPSRLQSFRDTVKVSYMRRGLIPFDADWLRADIEKTSAEIAHSKDYRAIFLGHLSIASMSLLLGETFQAEEHLDRGFKSGSVKHLSVYERCALIKGRILMQTESPQKASDHFRTLSRHCRKGQNYQHLRLAENNLAEVENQLIDDLKKTGARP